MVNGPPALPLVGSAHLFKWNPYAFTFQMEGWAQKYLFGRAKYGEIAAPNNEVDGIMLLWIGPVPIVFLGTSECIRVGFFIVQNLINIWILNGYENLEFVYFSLSWRATQIFQNQVNMIK